MQGKGAGEAGFLALFLFGAVRSGEGPGRDIAAEQTESMGTDESDGAGKSKEWSRMGKTTGFLDYVRMENPYRNEKERIQDYNDLHLPQPEEVRYAQASRCMNCGVPFCQSSFGCPLHNLIPEWNELLCNGREEEALKRLLMTAPFPEFTGRVCPALCEKACNLADEGVTNRDNELYLAETGFRKGWIRERRPRSRSGKRAAVVGSGPSGLAAADLLNQLGHTVTVIEKADRAGGLLMYGIPNMKLPKEIVDRRIRLMEAEGIAFCLNTVADSALRERYDAVILCGGARKPRTLNAEGMDAENVCFAVDYLMETTRALLEGRAPVRSARGKHVVVVGGGDTGNDCVGTVIRQRCASVTQLEMMPAAPEQRTANNPWPEWPRILRTDYGQQEAIALQGMDIRIFETTVQTILADEEHRVKALDIVRLEKDGTGRLTPAAGSVRRIPCDLLLIAAGFIGCEEETLEYFSLEADQRGRLLPGDDTHHLGGNLFAAGDMRNGQSLVVRALADGRAAALEVDAWLRAAAPGTLHSQRA